MGPLSRIFPAENRLEAQNKNPSTQVIFDVEESFAEEMVDVKDNCCKDLLMLQLMIDNQGRYPKIIKPLFKSKFDFQFLSFLK